MFVLKQSRRSLIFLFNVFCLRRKADRGGLKQATLSVETQLTLLALVEDFSLTPTPRGKCERGGVASLCVSVCVCLCVRVCARACVRAYVRAPGRTVSRGPRRSGIGLAAPPGPPAPQARPAPPRPAGQGAGSRSSLPPGGGKARVGGVAGGRALAVGAWRRWVAGQWVQLSPGLLAAVPCGIPSTWPALRPVPRWLRCRRSPRGPFLCGLSFQALGVGCASLRRCEKLAEMGRSKWGRKQRSPKTPSLQRGLVSALTLTNKPVLMSSTES